MDSDYKLVDKSNEANRDDALILSTFEACLKIAPKCPYDTPSFHPHRNLMITYAAIFDNEELFKQFAEKIISYSQLHSQKTRPSYTRITNGKTPDDINKIALELDAKKYRINVLHFLLVILRMQINGEASLLKKFSCYGIYVKILHILCHDTSSLALNLSNLLIENTTQEINNILYLNETHALNKLLKEFWPIFRNIMIEQVLSSREKIDNFCSSFKKTSFWTCYNYICLVKWQYAYINHKLNVSPLLESTEQAHLVTDLFFNSDAASITQLFNLDKEQSNNDINKLKNTIEFLTQKTRSIRTKTEESLTSIYKHSLSLAEPINALGFNLENISQSDNKKIVSNSDLFEKASSWLPTLFHILSQKNGLDFDNYQTTLTDFLALNDCLRPLELIELLPHILKINDLWLNYFKTSLYGLVCSLLVEKHQWLHKKFTIGLEQAEKFEEIRHKKNVSAFVREFNTIAKNISPEQSHSTQSIELVEALLQVHQDVFDGKAAPVRINEAFNFMLVDLKKLATEASIQQKEKCTDKNDIYEMNRLSVIYAMQRIQTRYLFISCVLKHPKFLSSYFILEMNQHALFSEAFEIANTMTLLLINNQVPSEKQALLFPKLESIHFLENKHWKKHNTSLYHKLQKHSPNNTNLNLILGDIKKDLWTQNVNALLYKARYAHLKNIAQDKNCTQFISAANEQKNIFNQQKDFISKLCDITIEQQQKDHQNIIDNFSVIHPKKEKVFVKNSKTTIQAEIITTPKKMQPTTGLPTQAESPPKKSAVATNLTVQTQTVNKKVNTQKTASTKKTFKKTLELPITKTEALPQPLISLPSIPSVSYDIYDFVDLPVKLNSHSNKTTKKSKAIKKASLPQERLKAKVCNLVENPITKFKTNLSIILCPDVKAVLNSLAKEGATAYVRGGYVRDKLFNKPVNDADIVTDLEPSKIISKLEALDYSCKQATKIEDILLFTCRKKQGKGLPIDISFSLLSLEKEAAKCDLTINSYLCFEDGIIIDCLGVIDDLNASELKMVSNEEESFKTNPKKYLRIIRFSPEYKKDIPEFIIDLMKKNINIVSDLPYLIYIEHLKKLFLNGFSKDVFSILLNNDLLPIITNQLSSNLFQQIPNLLVFFNWSLKQIDDAIHLERTNKKHHRIEQILGLLLLPVFITMSHQLSAKKVVKQFIALHDKELSVEDKHMLIIRIENQLQYYNELYCPIKKQTDGQCQDITNIHTASTICYQFSSMSLNDKPNASLHEENLENKPLILSNWKKI